MDTTELDAAYRNLLTAAEAITDTTALPAHARSAVDWTLSHLALSDPILATAARNVLTGPPTTIDNRQAMDSTAIDSLIISTTHAQRVDLVRRNATDLSTAIKAIPDHAAATLVRLRLVSRDGQPVPDQQLSWSDLICLRATEHLPGHAARLRALATTK
ncbi:hypothetical protein [Microbispora sp. GKU 823]|uniref:hypothetical protein n=1 Tax=Microbispora sp. GKU 823 TaxID=1652100 RepID=UPI00117E80B8|nr:hypothetical protein [Microbispora sp. GKU 823]